MEEKEAELRHQESALVKLGELYRDHQCVYAIAAEYIRGLSVLLQQCHRRCRGHHPLALICVVYRESEDRETQCVFPRPVYVTCVTLASVRTLLDCFATIPNSQKIQIDVLTENIEWAKKEKRIFLKHSLETRLVSL